MSSQSPPKMCRGCSPASAASIDLRGRSCWCRKASDQFASRRMRRPRLLQRRRPITIAEYARRSGARAARVCEIQVTIGGLLPPSWHGGSSAHILVLPNQPKPASQSKPARASQPARDFQTFQTFFQTYSEKIRLFRLFFILILNFVW